MKNNITNLFVIVFSLLTNITLAQKNDCKLAIKADAFTNKVTIQSQLITMVAKLNLTSTKDSWSLDAALLFRDDSVFLGVVHTTDYPREVNKLLLKLDNGRVLDLQPSNSIDFEGDLFSRSTVTYFAINREILTALSANGVSLFRATLLYFENTPIFEGELKDKNKDKLKSSAACILGEISKIK